MTVTGSHQDLEALTLTLVAEFDATAEQVWQIWEDPSRLSGWWGPPTWPATVEQHDFVVAGRTRYVMTGPDGDKLRGWWTITAIEGPHRLEFGHGFAGADGEPLTSVEPTRVVVTIEALGAGSRMTTVTTFATAEQLAQALAMGWDEDTRQAVAQVDALLTDTPR